MTALGKLFRTTAFRLSPIYLTVFALFAAFYYWWPKMFGRLLDERLGKLNFWLYFIGINLTFFPQHFLGLLGMPRLVWTWHGNGWWQAVIRHRTARSSPPGIRSAPCWTNSMNCSEPTRTARRTRHHCRLIRLRLSTGTAAERDSV